MPSTKHPHNGSGARHASRKPADGRARGRGGNPKHRPGNHAAQKNSTPYPQSDGPCPLMRACGGCEWLGLPYRKQLARKQTAMQELFQPVLDSSRSDVRELEPIFGMGGRAGDGKIASPRAFRYKAATPFAPGEHGEVRCGFFARGTHRIIEVPNCIVEAPGAREILNGVARIAQELGIPAYDEDGHQGILRYAVLRLGWKTDQGVLTLVTSRRDVAHLDELALRAMQLDPRITCVAQNINPRVTNAILGGETRVIAGSPSMRDKLLGCTFEISPTAFYQTNPQQTELLYKLAIDGMGLTEGDVLMDAYCGSGTIGLCAAADARERGASISLLGVERNAAGIIDAKANAELNGLANSCEFVAKDATEFMLEAAREGRRIDVLSIDPPRAGSTPEFLDAAISLAPRRITYISCNPQTQCRDLQHLMQGGYHLERLSLVDMFPHTTHVETVAVLRREQ